MSKAMWKYIVLSISYDMALQYLSLANAKDSRDNFGIVQSSHLCIGSKKSAKKEAPQFCSEIAGLPVKG
jgi:hypothetical protein